MAKTVILRYSSWENITFHGEWDTEIPIEEWKEMDQEEQDAFITDYLFNLVDVEVVDE